MMKAEGTVMRYELRLFDPNDRLVDRFVFFTPSDAEAGRIGQAVLGGREGELWRDSLRLRRWAPAGV